MYKYVNLATTAIEVDLENNYKIIAMSIWNKEINRYNLKFYIKRNDTDILDLIEKLENATLQSDSHIIKSNLVNHIADLVGEGFFNYYFKRYEYILKCFDRGNKLFEKENYNWMVNENV